MSNIQRKYFVRPDLLNVLISVTNVNKKVFTLEEINLILKKYIYSHKDQFFSANTSVAFIQGSLLEKALLQSTIKKSEFKFLIFLNLIPVRT